VRVSVAALNVDTRELNFRLVARAGGTKKSPHQAARQIRRQARQKKQIGSPGWHQEKEPTRQTRTPRPQAALTAYRPIEETRR